MANFKPGDLVELKSSGPVMVIESIDPFTADSFKCSWFAGEKHQENTFPGVALTLADEDAQ